MYILGTNSESPSSSLSGALGQSKAGQALTADAAGIARMLIWLGGSFTALSLWVEAGDKLNSILG